MSMHICELMESQKRLTINIATWFNFVLCVYTKIDQTLFDIL